ncbi:hypothetical protein [Vibrio gallicus]|uniref:hypothetical protein n=1 Tax=Vibrio gallicus TaxID=190897 RepID=UPI0021C3B647|nr:hypothetical protein [Vibrio gallicus]
MLSNTPRNMQGGALLIVMSLMLVLGVYSIYQFNTVSQRLLWHQELIMSRTQLNLTLDSALNCYALHYPDASPCHYQSMLDFDSEFIAVNQVRLTVLLGEAKRAQVMYLGGELAEHALVTDDNAIVSVFGRQQTELEATFEATNADECGSALALLLEQGYRSIWIKGDCQITADKWQVVTTYQPQILLFSATEVFISGAGHYQGSLLFEGVASDGLQGQIALQGITLSGYVVIDGELILDDVALIPEVAQLSQSLIYYANRHWQAWSWYDL